MLSEKLIKANKGLPTVQLKGKDYVMVKDRVTSFRKHFDGWDIITTPLEISPEHCVFGASVIDENGKTVSTGHAMEYRDGSNVNKSSYVENCETSAVGRALAFLGIGIAGEIGSADEMTNAIACQEALTKISKKEWERLVGVAEMKGHDVGWLLARCGVHDGAEITRRQYAEVVMELGS